MPPLLLPTRRDTDLKRADIGRWKDSLGWKTVFPLPSLEVAQTGSGEFWALLTMGDHPASECASHHPPSGSWRSRHHTDCSLFPQLLPLKSSPSHHPQALSPMGFVPFPPSPAPTVPGPSLCIGDAPRFVPGGWRPILQPGQDTISQLQLIESSKFWGEHPRVKSARNFPVAHPA